MTETSSDLAIGKVDFGHKPGLIVVDMSNGFTSENSPLGGEFSAQVSSANRLIEGFHSNNFPVFLSTVVYHHDKEQKVFRQHLPALDILQAGSDWVKIDSRLTLVDSDVIVEKTGPSAFFGTSLPQQLKDMQVDSLMICGLTTSGCVRATVVDALQYDYPAWVVEDACGDRNLNAQRANLHDMHAKYAKVVSEQDALQFLTK